MFCIKTDILILGSGLSGMRAALSASLYTQEASVVLVSKNSGLTGSSFANQNQKLGMQVLSSDREKMHFVQLVKKIASPGRIKEELVDVLVDESKARFNDLLAMGVSFQRNVKGDICYFPGCFDPGSKTAVIMDDLPGVYNAFYGRLKDRIRFLHGFIVIKLVLDKEQSHCVGAVLFNPVAGEFLALQARCIIVALGGAAPLFYWNQAGSGNPGYSLALLDMAGVKLVNHGFMQIMWATVPDKRFFSFHSFIAKTKFYKRNGEWMALPGELLNFLPERFTHCPASFGLRDSRVDEFLFYHLQSEGTLLLDVQGKEIVIAPMAHAINGGALVDRWGQTNVKCLFVCGECAAGMHGANRIGGAMVTATQVFGHRAGIAAARLYNDISPLPEKIFMKLVKENIFSLKPVKPCSPDRRVHSAVAGTQQFTPYTSDIDLFMKALYLEDDTILARVLSIIRQAREEQRKKNFLEYLKWRTLEIVYQGRMGCTSFDASGEVCNEC